MKYKIVGPRILLKVNKLQEGKDETFEGSSILMPEKMKEMETTYQTIGEVVQIGPTVKTKYEGFDDLQEGNIVHFIRYGAQRIDVKKNSDIEYWIVDGKDVLCITDQE